MGSLASGNERREEKQALDQVEPQSSGVGLASNRLLSDRPAPLFRGEEIALSDRIPRAREQLLSHLLGPAAGKDPEFTGQYLIDHLDKFELVPGELRIRVSTSNGQIWTGPGMTYSCWTINLEIKAGDEWQSAENLRIAGEAGTAYRDGRNRVTELCIASDTMLGNLDRHSYQLLLQKLVDEIPPFTTIHFSTNDPITLLELCGALPDKYRDFDKPRDFYFSEAEVTEVLLTASSRYGQAKYGMRPLLTERERSILETTLADMSVLGSGKLTGFEEILIDGFMRTEWPSFPHLTSFFEFEPDTKSLFAASYLLSHTSRAQSAYEAGLRSFRLQLAYGHGETIGAPLWRPPDGKFEVCFTAKKGRGLFPVPHVALEELLEVPQSPTIIIDEAPSRSRAMLEELHRTRRASRRDELLVYESPQMIEIMEMLAKAEGRDLGKVRPYLRFPEENLLVLPPQDPRWRMDRKRFEAFAASSRIGNEELGPLARSYYSQAERILMERINPTADLAVVFIYRGSNYSSVDRKDDECRLSCRPGLRRIL